MLIIAIGEVHQRLDVGPDGHIYSYIGVIECLHIQGIITLALKPPDKAWLGFRYGIDPVQAIYEGSVSKKYAKVR